MKTKLNDDPDTHKKLHQLAERMMMVPGRMGAKERAQLHLNSIDRFKTEMVESGNMSEDDQALRMMDNFGNNIRSTVELINEFE